MIPYCLAHGIGLIPWGPVGAGYLARPLSASAASERHAFTASTPAPTVLNAAEKAIISRVEALAKEKGWTMAQVSLVWMMDTVSSPIVGVSSPARLEDAIGINGKKLSAEEKKNLEEPYIDRKVKGHA